MIGDLSAALVGWVKSHPAKAAIGAFIVFSVAVTWVRELGSVVDDPGRSAQYSLFLLAAVAGFPFFSLGLAWSSIQERGGPDVLKFGVAAVYAVLGGAGFAIVWFANDGLPGESSVEWISALSLVAWPYAIEAELGPRPTGPALRDAVAWRSRLALRGLVMIGACVFIAIAELGSGSFGLPKAHSFGLAAFVAFEAAELLADLHGLSRSVSGR